MSAALQLREVALHRGGRAVLEHITLDLPPARVTALLGANGSGKSTLLAALAGEQEIAQGTLLLHGTDPARLAARARGRRRAALAQDHELRFALPVTEVVALGGIAFGGAPAALVQQALADLDLAPHAARAYTTLSGGERQRVQLARVLVQARLAPAAQRVLLLDEPLAALDLRHQLQLLALLRAEAAAGALVLLSLHDPALAWHYADEVLCVADGALCAHGPARSTLTPAVLQQVYGIPFCDDGRGPRPQLPA